MPDARTRWRRRIVSVLIVWHITAMAVWLLPASYLRQGLLRFVRPYIIATGCWQQWSFFGPVPVHTDVHVEARITYSNGVRKSWFFPRPAVQTSLSSDQSERFANFIAHANAIYASDPSSSGSLWPYMARYAARVCRRPAVDAPPVHVDMLRYQRDIAPPDTVPSPFVYETVYSGDIR